MATRLLNTRDTYVSDGFYYLLVAYGVLSVAFSGEFYRFQVGMVSPSEIILLISFLIFFVYKDLYRIVGEGFYLMVALWGGWLFISLVSEGRENYFVFRQCMSVPYLMFAPLLLIALNVKDKRPGSIEYSLFCLAVVLGISLDYGHMDVAIPLLLWLLFLTESVGLIAVLAISIAFVFTGHASHKLALVIYLSVRYLKYWVRYLPVVTMVALIFVAYFVDYLYESGELTDVNAMWRYIYWADMFEYMLTDFRWLSGVGYGIPYINPDFENFQLLFGQIESGKGDFQMYAVPPHNSFLVLFYHLGIFGFIAGVVVWFSPIVKAVKMLHFNAIGALLGVLFIMLTHNAMELPYTAIYCSAVLASAIRELGGKIG